MNITEVIATELSGFCDVQTGECVVIETSPPTAQNSDDAPPSPAREDPPRDAGEPSGPSSG